MLEKDETLRKKEGSKKISSKVKLLKEGSGFKYAMGSGAIMITYLLWSIYNRRMSHSSWQATEGG